MPLGPFPGPDLRGGGLDVDYLPSDEGAGVTFLEPKDPMGEVTGTADLNDITDPRNPTRLMPKYAVPAVRVTLRVVEDIEARTERIFTPVIWLPGG